MVWEVWEQTQSAARKGENFFGFGFNDLISKELGIMDGYVPLSSW